MKRVRRFTEQGVADLVDYCKEQLAGEVAEVRHFVFDHGAAVGVGMLMQNGRRYGVTVHPGDTGADVIEALRHRQRAGKRP